MRARTVAIVSPTSPTYNASTVLELKDPPGVVVIDRAGGTVMSIPEPRKPTELRRLAGGTHFQITAADDGAVWVLSTARQTPRLTFIPPPALADRGGVR